MMYAFEMFNDAFRLHLGLMWEALARLSLRCWGPLYSVATSYLTLRTSSQGMAVFTCSPSAHLDDNLGSFRHVVCIGMSRGCNSCRHDLDDYIMASVSLYLVRSPLYQAYFLLNRACWDSETLSVRAV